MSDTSAHAQIYLYKETGLNPANNYLIENISNFLGTGTYIEYFQFLELKPKMTIKIQKAQNYLQFDANYDYDYCHISNAGYGFDDPGAYYYIVGKHWKSKDCLEFELEMDVLNSFEWDSDYTVSEKTFVKRQHKDRYSNVTAWTYLSDNFSLEANTPKTFTIQTPLMQSARIKFVSDIVLSGATSTPTFVPSTVTSMSNNVEYYFAESGSCPSPLSRIQTSGNNILFRRYSADGNLLESMYIGRAVINPDEGTITVYIHTGGSTYTTYKTVSWNDYPLSSGSNSGKWTLTPESTLSGYNMSTFYTGLGGTVTQSVAISKTVNAHDVELTFTASSAISSLAFFFAYEVYAYVANIDLKSEGINPPLYKVTETDLGEPSGVSWSLLYKNGDTNVVDCYLYPSTNLLVEVPGSTNTLTKDNVPNDKYAIIFGDYNNPTPTFSFTNDNNQDVNYTPRYAETLGGDKYIYGIAFKATADGVNIWTITVTYSVYAGYWWGSWIKVGTDVSSVGVTGSLASLAYYPNASLPAEDWISQHYNEQVYATGTISMAALVQATLNDKTNINRADEDNIKLITLPYAPTPVYIDHNTGKAIIGSEWYFNSTDGTLKLTDLNAKFTNRIQTEAPSLISEMLTHTYHVTLDGTANRANKDPKLYHSDYYYRKFVYDSFSKIFRSENLDWDACMRENPNNPYFYFDFVTSRNIVSKFMFMFPLYITGNKGTEDYDNILPVARNNEEVLYNSQYLNYLRTGYNYDLKTKQRNEATGAAGLGISIASLIASIGLTASGYGTAIGIAGIVGSVAGIAGSAINYAKTTAQAEENIQRKLQESQNQAVSVLNADDYDLLEAYSGNVAKMCTYEVSTQMRDALDDMFYYSGYVINEQYKPSVNIRYWFDFLQADLVIDYTQNLSQEITELIKKKFSEGVTFFHCHNLGTAEVPDYTWDLDQEKENWEKWIVLANGGAN